MIRLIGGIEIYFLLFLFSTKAVNLTLAYKNSARNADSMLYKCFKMRNLGVVSLNYARPPFRWVVFKARSREISTRSKCP